MKNNHIFNLIILIVCVFSSCDLLTSSDLRDQFLGEYSGQNYESRSLVIASNNDFAYSYAATLEINTSENDNEVKIILELCHPNGDNLEFDFIGNTNENNSIMLLDKEFLVSIGDQRVEFTDGSIEFTTDVNIRFTLKEKRTNATNNQALDDNDYISTHEIIFNEKGSSSLNC